MPDISIPPAAAVIVGGGSGTRFGGEKLTVPLAGKPLIAHTLEAFEATEAIARIALVVPEGREEEYRAIAAAAGISKLAAVVTGGAQRHHSVLRGLKCLGDEIGLVAIHDAARPLVTPCLITRVLEAAAREGAAAAAAPVTDTLHRSDASGYACGTVERTLLRAMQTPQVFRPGEIKALLEEAPGMPTDEVSVAMAAGWRVFLVEHTEPNLKVTWPHDIVMAEALLRTRNDKESAA